jgi:hypothetical protein
VKIELLKGGMVNQTITSSVSMGSNGSCSYNWTIPTSQTAGNDYRVRVTSTTNSSYTDTSDNNFNITALPRITLSSPNGGETLQAGSTQTIRWTYTGNPGTAVRIELLQGGAVNQAITASASMGNNGNGSYIWTVPASQTTGTNFTVRVTSTNNAAYTDISDNNFTITRGSIASQSVLILVHTSVFGGMAPELEQFKNDLMREGKEARIKEFISGNHVTVKNMIVEE